MAISARLGARSAPVRPFTPHGARARACRRGAPRGCEAPAAVAAATPAEAALEAATDGVAACVCHLGPYPAQPWSARRGTGTVVGEGGLIATAAHVACFRGKDNKMEVRACVPARRRGAAPCANRGASAPRLAPSVLAAASERGADGQDGTLKPTARARRPRSLGGGGRAGRWPWAFGACRDGSAG